MATTSISSVASEPEHNTKSRELEEENATKTGAADDEDTGAQVAPIVKLEEVPVTTGEEDEDAILDLYFFFIQKMVFLSLFIFE